MTLASHPHRFSEIKRRINGISQRMLTLCAAINGYWAMCNRHLRFFVREHD
ncbi:winged helix-turn-helix transcriptional regulator [Acinetobacter baumannii]|nr:winged helix-turn-helix transcriptional regulator [Acinetobacter baumannii]MDH2511869.1 winged helix-turn-helix transcriptional regulator [Acinetobacter baumannii]